VRSALERWEPRIDVDDVEISFDAVDSGVLYIDVRYSLRGTNDPRNLVFPFYLIGENEPPALTSAATYQLTADVSDAAAAGYGVTGATAPAPTGGR
jgi:hypothetical protein